MAFGRLVQGLTSDRVVFMNSEVEVEVVSADSADDPRLSVKLVRGFVVGSRYREAGEVVSLPREHAIRAYRGGIVVPSGALATLVLLAQQLFASTPSKPPAAPLVGGTLIRVLDGVFFDGPQSRSFTSADGPVMVYSQIPLECMVESQPASDSGERRERTVVQLQMPPEELARVISAKRRASAKEPLTDIGPTGCRVHRALPVNR
jgi:hypothetical protein